MLYTEEEVEHLCWQALVKFEARRQDARYTKNAVKSLRRYYMSGLFIEWFNKNKKK